MGIVQLSYKFRQFPTGGEHVRTSPQVKSRPCPGIGIADQNPPAAGPARAFEVGCRVADQPDIATGGDSRPRKRQVNRRRVRFVGRRIVGADDRRKPILPAKCADLAADRGAILVADHAGHGSTCRHRIEKPFRPGKRCRAFQAMNAVTAIEDFPCLPPAVAEQRRERFADAVANPGTGFGFASGGMAHGEKRIAQGPMYDRPGIDQGVVPVEQDRARRGHYLPPRAKRK